MTTRLDSAIQKHPDHEEAIRLLASRDPSGNLKYLDWGAKMLAAGQALAPEIGDVLDLFHRFRGLVPERRRLRQAIRDRIHPDINSYRPQDFAALRDNLRKLQRAQDRKRKKREKLYRLEREVEAEVIYDADDLVVRFIKNKEASVHYGHGTRWCISMLREGYFQDYETSNAVFFFFERKAPKDDAFDKVAVMVPREGGNRDQDVQAFTAEDCRVDMFVLARVYGPHVFGIFRQIYEASASYPGSAMYCVYSGTATSEQVRAVYAMVVDGRLATAHGVISILESICCNDATPAELLVEIAQQASALVKVVWKKQGGGALRRRRRTILRTREAMESHLTRTFMAALVIHPATPPEMRERCEKELRRRHVNIAKIRRVSQDEYNGHVGILYRDEGRFRTYRHRRHRRLQDAPMGWLHRRVKSYEFRIKQTKQAIKKKTAELARKKRRKKR
jgi:hypothetical protein